MAGADEILSLIKTSSEIDESDIKITYANQCVKGQEFITNKLKQEIQRREEQCHFLNNDNRKLETEIKHAEYEIKSASISLESIRSANIELRKELLLAKESYIELVERVRDGEKKYDDLWVQAKQRFESIPFVQEWMGATKQVETIQSSLNILDHETNVLEKEIIKKKALVLEEERREIIKLAEFMVEREAMLKTIREKQDEVAELSKEVEVMKAKQGIRSDPASISSPKDKMDQKEPEGTGNGQIVDENWCNLSKNIYEDSLMIPRLHLPSVDNDVLNVKLDITKVASLAAPIRRMASITEFDKNANQTKSDDTNDEYMSCYFSKPKPVLESDRDGKQDKAGTYSTRKLINILDDMKLDENETSKILSEVNPESLREVDTIRRDTRDTIDANDNVKAKKAKGPIVSEVIEEIDLTNRSSQNLLMPPTQFGDHEDMARDISEAEGVVEVISVIEHVAEDGYKENIISETKESSQSKSILKKTVSFDVPMSATVHEISDDNICEDTDNEANLTVTSVISQTGSGVGNDDNYMMMKEMILKKHNLDLSPQFFYAKNNMLKKQADDKVVTSKFFEGNGKEDANTTAETEDNEVQDMETSVEENAPNENATEKIIEVPQSEENVEMEEGDDSPPEQKQDSGSPVTNEKVPDKPVAGLLFAHGPQGIPECLDISMSTTGYEEGDTDFLHCLDSSLLLSPKADNDMAGPSEGVSQEVPNFLSGFKKGGLSFFKSNPSVENTGSADAQKPDNNFNFNFGSGEEKKTKGGLFSFFR